MRSSLLPVVLASAAPLFVGGCTREVTLFGASTENLCVQGEGVTFRCFGIDSGSEAWTPGVPTTRIAVFAGGVGASCALEADGTPRCWGPSDGEANIGDGPWSEIALGSAHGCGARPSGERECWGVDLYGETHIPEGEFTAVVPGDHYTCGLRADGAVECWGGREITEGYWADAPDDARFVEIQGRTLTMCGLDSDRRLQCWGRNLGTLLSPPDEPGVQRVSVGVKHACAVMADGRIECWGEDTFGVVSKRPAGPWADVAAGRYSNCALGLDLRTVRCWGNVDSKRESFDVVSGPA